MSTEIPVFLCAVSCDAVHGCTLTYDEALSLISDNNLLSISTSRNWWYQGLVAKLIGIYEGFEELRYINEVVAIIETEQLAPTADVIRSLMETIRGNTEPFVRISTWCAAPSAEEVCEYIAQANAYPDLDDDCIYAFGNFFSFLVSQAGALDEAKKQGSCVLYVQLQP
jgi:hypothetical protein